MSHALQLSYKITTGGGWTSWTSTQWPLSLSLTEKTAVQRGSTELRYTSDTLYTTTETETDGERLFFVKWKYVMKMLGFSCTWQHLHHISVNVNAISKLVVWSWKIPSESFLKYISGLGYLTLLWVHPPSSHKAVHIHASLMESLRVQFLGHFCSHTTSLSIAMLMTPSYTFFLHPPSTNDIKLHFTMSNTLKQRLSNNSF